MTTPFFSIVVVWYEGTQGYGVLRNALSSIPQDKSLCEVIVMHDGPIKSAAKENIPADLVLFTKNRYNDWGHTPKHMAIPTCRGEYIIWLNADNMIYPHALRHAKDRLEQLNKPKVAFFPVLMEGYNQYITKDASYGWYDQPRDPSKAAVLNGIPLVIGNVDLMCGVIRTEVWKACGWWDKAIDSDFTIFKKLATEHGSNYVNVLLGIHR